MLETTPKNAISIIIYHHLSSFIVIFPPPAFAGAGREGGGGQAEGCRFEPIRSTNFNGLLRTTSVVLRLAIHLSKNAETAGLLLAPAPRAQIKRGILENENHILLWE
ncbi:MAG: hypothetical protein AAB543_02815 [Pseudomonadota bacterium]